MENIELFQIVKNVDCEGRSLYRVTLLGHKPRIVQMQHKWVDITLGYRLWRQFLDKVFSLSTDVLMYVAETDVANTSFLQNLARGFPLERCISNQKHIDYNTYAHEVLLDPAVIVALGVFKVV